MPNEYRPTTPHRFAVLRSNHPGTHSPLGQRTLGWALQPTPEVTQLEETLQELQWANSHMPWQSHRQQRPAQGVLLSLAPHPAVEGTHLAPCWTFIRSDLHQMVAAFWHWCRWVHCWRRGHISPRQGSPDWSGSSSTDAKTAALAATKAAWLGASFYAGVLQPQSFQRRLFTNHLFLLNYKTERQGGCVDVDKYSKIKCAWNYHLKLKQAAKKLSLTIIISNLGTLIKNQWSRRCQYSKNKDVIPPPSSPNFLATYVKNIQKQNHRCQNRNIFIFPEYPTILGSLYGLQERIFEERWTETVFSHRDISSLKSTVTLSNVTKKEKKTQKTTKPEEHLDCYHCPPACFPNMDIWCLNPLHFLQ